jgi:hypothetical protein
MTPRQIIAVGVRCFAVWLLFDALGTGYFAFELRMNSPRGALALGLVLTLVWLLAALTLWHFPQAVARKLLPNDVDAVNRDSSGISADIWLATGCALIGVWVLVASLPSLAQNVAGSWPKLNLSDLDVYFVVRIVLGVWLILGARGLREVVRWTQYAGIRRSEESSHGQ